MKGIPIIAPSVDLPLLSGEFVARGLRDGSRATTLNLVPTTYRLGVNMLTLDLIPDGSEALLGAHIATGYCPTMMSALYAMTSTGSLELYPGEGAGRIVEELRCALSVAECEFPEDIAPLQAFLEFCENLV